MTVRPRSGDDPLARARRTGKRHPLEALSLPALPPEAEPAAPAMPTGQQYANYVGAPGFFLLNAACRALNDAFADHCCVYLVGSATKRRDWRDIDVRAILDDDAWDRLFPEVAGESARYCDRHALWSLMCSSISLYLRQQSGLPIDFQIQRQSVANAQFPRAQGHDRQALGLFLSPEKR